MVRIATKACTIPTVHTHECVKVRALDIRIHFCSLLAVPAFQGGEAHLVVDNPVVLVREVNATAPQTFATSFESVFFLINDDR